MRILHSSFSVFEERGIQRQLRYEIEAARLLGLDWDAKLFCSAFVTLEGEEIVKLDVDAQGCNNAIFKKIVFWLRIRKRYYKELKDRAKDYDILLLRHSVCDPFRAGFVKSVGKPVYSVHHVIEDSEIKLNGSRGTFFKRIGEKVFGTWSLDQVTGIIGVTSEICDHERSRVKTSKPSFIYPNGVSFGEGVGNILDLRNELRPEIVFVASYFAPWQGLDELLRSLENCKDDFLLHIVGEVDLEDKNLGVNDSRVVFHGAIDQHRLNALLACAWVGLSSFALEKQGLSQACSLKVREYLSHGVPVYSGHRDVFGVDFPFYKIGRPCINLILNFAYKCRRFDRQEVRNRAEPFISKPNLLAGLYDWLVKQRSPSLVNVNESRGS